MGRDRWTQGALLMAVGLMPDLDLLWGRHSHETHSIGAALIVATVAAWRRWPVASTRWRVWCAVLAAYLTHPLLDALAQDTSSPIGIMAFWPWSREFYSTGWGLVGPISRRYWTEEFWVVNVASVSREVLLFGPVALAVYMRARIKRAVTQ